MGSSLLVTLLVVGLAFAILVLAISSQMRTLHWWQRPATIGIGCGLLSMYILDAQLFIRPDSIFWPLLFSVSSGACAFFTARNTVEGAPPNFTLTFLVSTLCMATTWIAYLTLFNLYSAIEASTVIPITLMIATIELLFTFVIGQKMIAGIKGVIRRFQ